MLTLTRRKCESIYLGLEVSIDPNTPISQVLPRHYRKVGRQRLYVRISVLFRESSRYVTNTVPV